MSSVVLSDEEIEVQRKELLASDGLTQSQCDAINADFSSAAQERETTRQERQANYDRHKGRV